MKETTIPQSDKCFTFAERHTIIQELLQTNCTKQEFWQKYRGKSEELMALAS